MREYCANCSADSRVTPAGYGAQIAGGASNAFKRSRQATWMSRSDGCGATSLSASGGVGVPSRPDDLRALKPFGGHLYDVP